MMSGVPLETCWAFNKLWNNKFYYKAASCWYFYCVHFTYYYNVYDSGHVTQPYKPVMLCSALRHLLLYPKSNTCVSGFSGLVVSMLASGIQVRVFKPG